MFVCLEGLSHRLDAFGMEGIDFLLRRISHLRNRDLLPDRDGHFRRIRYGKIPIKEEKNLDEGY